MPRRRVYFDGLTQRPWSGASAPVRGRGAFTLLEILLVMVLLAALAALAMPLLEKRIESSEIPESADKLRSLLFMTRSQAILDHKRYRVRFDLKEQQPIVEVEPDPINTAGEFVATDEPWAMENILLGDVKVHAVKLGRPVYMTPQQTADDADAQSAEGLTGVLTKAQEEVAEMTQGRQEFGEESDWPAIIFDVDGSTDWATVIISYADAKEELKPEDEQRWIVLDGRTGLAKITEQVTVEQLADAGFYVDRDKLGMPELGEDGQVVFNNPAGGTGSGATSGDPSAILGALGAAAGGGGQSGGLGAIGAAAGGAGLGNLGAAAGQLPGGLKPGDLTGGGKGGDTNPGMNRPGGGRRPGGADTPGGQKGGRPDGQPPRRRGEGGGRAENQPDGRGDRKPSDLNPSNNSNSDDSLNKAMSDPNLTPEQREEIRKQFRSADGR